jgi:hypothetical protein
LIVAEIEKFLGINNVEPEERLAPGEFTAAVNVNIDASEQVLRRAGRALLQPGIFHSLFEGEAMTLVVKNGSLVRIDAVGATLATVFADIGARRISYQPGVNGRVYFTNGVTQGSTDGSDYIELGIPRPPHVGNAGSLGPGETFEINVAIGYRRLADGMEGGLTHGMATTNGTELSFVGLPELLGFEIVVYAAPARHLNLYRLGSTPGSTFGFVPDGAAGNLPTLDAIFAQMVAIRSLRVTEFLDPPPTGTIMRLWNGRLLIADGNVLWASRPYTVELFDLSRDFKQLDAPITLLEPVKNGLWVGTTEALHFLAGSAFDALSISTEVDGPVVLGSGVQTEGSWIRGRLESSLPAGEAVLCIAKGAITACTGEGRAVPLTDRYYLTEATEVDAAVVLTEGYPQYVATPIP